MLPSTRGSQSRPSQKLMPGLTTKTSPCNHHHATITMLEKELNNKASHSHPFQQHQRHAPRKYLAITGIAFVVAPLNPGMMAAHTVGATRAQITKTNTHFDASQTEFQQFTTTKGMLKCKILATVDAMYIDELNNDNLGFTTAMCLTLLQQCTAMSSTRTILASPLACASHSYSTYEPCTAPSHLTNWRPRRTSSKNSANN